MMPALLMSTLTPGCCFVTAATNGPIDSRFSMSNASEAIPGLALVTSSRAAWRRPEMMTLLPAAWNASARPRPIPEPPPVMRMVLPVVCMAPSPCSVWVLVQRCGRLAFVTAISLLGGQSTPRAHGADDADDEHGDRPAQSDQHDDPPELRVDLDLDDETDDH